MSAVTTVPAQRNRPAGLVTRALAAAIDLAVVLVMMGVVLLSVAGFRFLWSPLSFRWPAPSWPLSLLVGALLAAGYLTAACAVSGRTYGGALLGLRIVSARGSSLGWARAGLRAVLVLVFPLGLLWVAVSRHRRSVADVVLSTAVLYDWHDDVGLRERASPGGLSAEHTDERLDGHPDARRGDRGRGGAGSREGRADT